MIYCVHVLDKMFIFSLINWLIGFEVDLMCSIYVAKVVPELLLLCLHLLSERIADVQPCLVYSVLGNRRRMHAMQPLYQLR